MKLSKKYTLIIVASILLAPLSYFGVNFAYYAILTNVADHSSENFRTEEELTYRAKTFTESLQNQSTESIISSLQQEETQDTRILWVNDQGQSLYSESTTPTDTTSTIALMKEKENEGFFVTSSYIEGSEDQGYVLFMVPHSKLGTSWTVLRDRYAVFWFIALGLIWFVFIFVSWLFFKKISTRLRRMQQNMESNQNRVIPTKLTIEKHDEIGELGQSFNHMVEQLLESRQKEKNEEGIRKKLIASLSHDLRTPLAVMNGHAYNLKQQPLTTESQHAVTVIQQKIDFVSELIENLTSYTVLSEGKLPQRMERVNVTQLVQSTLIEYYPLFEQEDFEVDAHLVEPLYWQADSNWVKRILDNLFQNVLRHASEGKYIGVQTTTNEGQPAIRVEDHGPGMNSTSSHKGTGIGLSIVDMMLDQMNLAKEVHDLSPGTVILLYPKKD